MSPFSQDLQAAFDQCRSGDFTQADSLYQRLRLRPPEAACDGDGLATLAGMLGYEDEALMWLERAAATDPPDTRRLTALGTALLARRRTVEAADAFSRALDTGGDGDGDGDSGDSAGTGPACAGLALALRELGRWDEAVSVGERAADLTPGDPAVWSGLAFARVNRQQVEAAEDAARRALALDDAHAPAWRALALTALVRQRPDEAERACRAALATDPDYPEGLSALALVRMVQNRTGEADALFRQATSQKPTLAEAFANHAALLARLGRDDEAVHAAARAVELKPFLPGPNALLGALWRKAGRTEDAAAAFARVLESVPAHLDARVNLADTLRLLGRPEQAAEVCRQGLELHPGHAGLLANLGAALHACGDAQGAGDAYAEALKAEPERPEVVNNLARLHHEAGRLGPALELLERARAARPDDLVIAGNLVSLLLDLDRAPEAGTVAALAVRANPASPEALCLVGQVLIRLGSLTEAEAAFREAIRLAPSRIESGLTAGAGLLRVGRRDRAFVFLRPLVRQAPANGRAWTLFAQSLRGQRLASADEELRADLAEALVQPGAEKPHLIEAVASAVALEPSMASLLSVLATGPDTSRVAAMLRAGELDGIRHDRLLQGLLDAAVIADAGLERALTALRRALLEWATFDGATFGQATFDQAPDGAAPPWAAWEAFADALARQCFLNEYAFALSVAERAAVDELGRSLAALLAAGERPPPTLIALLAAYRPLHTWSGADAAVAAAGDWAPGLRRLVERQIAEPRAEAALIPTIPRLTAIDDSVSLAVRGQYEESPHPRWRHASLLEEPLPLSRIVRAMFPNVSLPPHGWPAPEVLIAGCGTGRESVWSANQIKGARILAVDLSLSSLAYARRQTSAMGLAGVTYAQADLLRLGELGRSFDLIQSIGVLHHTADTLAAWKGLKSLLRPDGLMTIGLYSQTARQAVVAAHELIASRGLGTGVDDIRRFRQIVLALPPDHPARQVVHSVDFYSTSACRDLLFHVHELRTSLNEVAGWLDELGLEFLGFQLDDMATADLYRRRFPEDPAMTRLDLWDRFETENPTTFGGLYQFWVRHDRRPS
jgi:tetratricopeptide (TPR) repeat protein/2-polyprenyl-3-methyl-5-hydroxy-6-metoxy-1,4-benzoquinol methylase